LYATLKWVHIAAVVLSGAGFVVRYALAAGGRLPQRAIVRIAPHVVDTMLLASALALVWIAGMQPLEIAWLRAKLIGLAIYVVAGTIALKRGRTSRIRAAAFIVALGTLAWIVSVAVTKSPWGMLTGVFG
jgi:uncharacterized membrane protein SirB2